MMNFIKIMLIKAGIILLYYIAGLITIGPNFQFLICLFLMVILHYLANIFYNFLIPLAITAHFNKKAFILIFTDIVIILIDMLPMTVLTMNLSYGVQADNQFTLYLLAFAMLLVSNFTSKDLGMLLASSFVSEEKGDNDDAD